MVKWLVQEADSHIAVALWDSWSRGNVQPIAPALMPIEVSNALYRRVIRRELSVSIASRLVANLLASGIELRESPILLGKTMQLALQLGQGAIYDSHYLTLAESLNCDLWTADERFFRAASPVTPNIRLLGEFVASQ